MQVPDLDIIILYESHLRSRITRYHILDLGLILMVFRTDSLSYETKVAIY